MQPFERYKHIVDDYPAFAESLQKPLPVTFWANPERITEDELVAFLENAGFPVPDRIPWTEGAYKLPPERRVGKRWEFFAGLFQIQEEAAMLPVHLLQPRSGETVLDMCAAPGNKTAQIALAMNHYGTVISNDLNAKRVSALKQTCERLGLSNVVMTNNNGTNLRGDAALFDRILVDAPCSGEGTTRKIPHPCPQSNPRFCVKQQRVQQALLSKAFQLCKVGGRIVYATCTYAPEENEVVLQNMLDYLGRDCIRVVRVHPPENLAFSNGLSEWDGQRFYHEITRSVRLWPQQNDTGGFFIAVLKKIGTRKEREYQPYVPVSEWARQEQTETEKQLLADVRRRFGLPDDFFPRGCLIPDRKKEMSLVDNSIHIPEAFRMSRIGLRFLHQLNHESRLTHPGAMAAASSATRNVIELDEQQRTAFFQRRVLPLSQHQVHCCDGPGYVLCTFAGKGVGGGVLKQNEEGGWYLKSSFPKTWARRLLGIKEDKTGPAVPEQEENEKQEVSGCGSQVSG